MHIQQYLSKYVHYAIMRVFSVLCKKKKNQIKWSWTAATSLCSCVLDLLFDINQYKDMMEMEIMPHVWRMATKPTGLFWQVLLIMQMIYTVQT